MSTGHINFKTAAPKTCMASPLFVSLSLSRPEGEFKWFTKQETRLPFSFLFDVFPATALPCDFDQFGPEGFNVLQESFHCLSGAYNGLWGTNGETGLRKQQMLTRNWITSHWTAKKEEVDHTVLIAQPLMRILKETIKKSWSSDEVVVEWNHRSFLCQPLMCRCRSACPTWRVDAP